MTIHEKTIQQHVESNLAMAIDQEHEYEDAFSSFHQNTLDSCTEDGHGWEEAVAAGDLFTSLWETKR